MKINLYWGANSCEDYVDINSYKYHIIIVNSLGYYKMICLVYHSSWIQLRLGLKYNTFLFTEYGNNYDLERRVDDNWFGFVT